MTQSGETVAAARPFGPFGLLVSLAGIGVLTALILAAPLALAAGVDAWLMGREHLAASLQSLGELAGKLGDPSQAVRETVMAPMFVVGSLLYAAAMLAILSLARLRGGRDWRGLVAWRPFAPDAFYWFLVAGAVVYGLVAGYVIVKIHPEAKGWLVMPREARGLVALFALAVVMAPLTEELLFRGWIYTSLRARFGVAASIVVTGALFACAHWERTHLYALAVLPVGLLLGYVRERSGGLRAGLYMHSIYNCVALAKMVLPD